MSNKLLYAMFTASKDGKAGLTDVTVDVDKIARATSTRTVVVTGASATEGRNGYYYYSVASVDENTYDYVGVFKTADATVDLKSIPSLRSDGIDASGVGTGVVVGTTGASGAWTIDVTVRDASTLIGLLGAWVTVKGSGDTVVNDVRKTDVNGQCAGAYAFSLDDGTYKLHLSRPGYQSSIQTLVVNGANQSVTYDLTAVAVGTPADPTCCRIFGYVYLDGAPAAAVTVAHVLQNAPQVASALPGLILEKIESTALTDASGYWYFDLVKGKNYKITITAAGVAKVFQVPDLGSKDFSTFLP